MFVIILRVGGDRSPDRILSVLYMMFPIWKDDLLNNPNNRVSIVEDVSEACASVLDGHQRQFV